MREFHGKGSYKFVGDSVITGMNIRPENAERLKEAAVIANHLEGRNLFSVELVPEETSPDLDPVTGSDLVRVKVGGEYLAEQGQSASLLWRVKAGIDAYLAQGLQD